MIHIIHCTIILRIIIIILHMYAFIKKCVINKILCAISAVGTAIAIAKAPLSLYLLLLYYALIIILFLATGNSNSAMGRYILAFALLLLL